MKTFNVLMLLSVLAASSCSGDEPKPDAEEDDGCLTRWNQVMGKEGGLRWEPGKITISLTDPKADQYGLDVESTEVLYEREDEVSKERFDNITSGMHMFFADLDMHIKWEDLVLQDSVYVNLGFPTVLNPSRNNSKVSDNFAQLTGLSIFHNRVEIRMPFQETKILKLPSFPKSGELIVRKWHSQQNTTGDVKGTLIVNTAGVKDSLSYDGGSMAGLPYFSMYFKKDALGTSKITFNRFEFIETRKPVVADQNAASYTDNFQCNSTRMNLKF